MINKKRKHLLYILNGHTPIPIDSALEWAMRFDLTNRTVKHSTVGIVEISTVFLGINFQFSAGPPLLFETTILGGQFDQSTSLCSTWKQAERMHSDCVYKVAAMEVD